ncbi:hypothetical protein Q8A73_009661 [Channa argus]|nr:hypothetical protein Q8A73_009661 [Channa argus]
MVKDYEQLREGNKQPILNIMALPFLPENAPNKYRRDERFHKCNSTNFGYFDGVPMLVGSEKLAIGGGGEPLVDLKIKPKDSVYPQGQGSGLPSLAAFDRRPFHHTAGQTAADREVAGKPKQRFNGQQRPPLQERGKQRCDDHTALAVVSYQLAAAASDEYLQRRQEYKQYKLRTEKHTPFHHTAGQTAADREVAGKQIKSFNGQQRPPLQERGKQRCDDHTAPAVMSYQLAAAALDEYLQRRQEYKQYKLRTEKHTERGKERCDDHAAPAVMSYQL